MKRKIFLSIFSLGWSLTNLGVASAATYYVAKTGSDSNPCTAAAPCATISKGVSRATSPGDGIIVQSGTYLEMVSNWSSGSNGNPITLRANPGQLVIWKAPNTDPNSAAGAIYILDRKFIRIEGFNFDSVAAKSVIRVRNSNDNKSSPVEGIEIVNNIFTNNGHPTVGVTSKAIFFQSTGHATLEAGNIANNISGNKFDGNYGVGVWLIKSNDTVVSRNSFLNMKSSFDTAFATFHARGVFVTTGSSRNVVEFNDMSNFAVDSYVGNSEYAAEGIKLDSGSDRNIFRYNIVHDLDVARIKKRGAGIMFESGCDYNEAYENIVYNISDTGLKTGSRNTGVARGNMWINNTVYNCGCGIALINAGATVVRNNIVMNSSNANVWVTNLSVITGSNIFEYNNYYNASNPRQGAWNDAGGVCPSASLAMTEWTSSSGETHSISANPLFVNPPVDLHLAPASPSKKTGAGGADMGAFPEASTPSPLISTPSGLRVVE